MLGWKMTEVAPGFYRAPQPRPHHIPKLKAAGIKTILNLRGLHPYPGQEAWRTACAQAGFDYLELPCKSRATPPAAMIEPLLQAFDTAAYPALIHCKAGADRTGLACAFYRHYVTGQPIMDAAREQLSLRYGHFRIGKTGVLDFFFEAFAAQQDEPSFDAWWRGYDHEAVQAAFEASGRSLLRLDLLLRRE